MRALVGVLAIGFVAHAAQPYLPLTGPPPLRLLAVPSPQSLSVYHLAAGAGLGTNATSAAGEKNTATNGLPNVASQAATNGPPLATLIGPGADNAANEVFGSQIFALPTPDLLSVTPQMLAAYFGPVSRGTNTTAFVGPFPVGFVPPLAPPAQSSHAEYQVK